MERHKDKKGMARGRNVKIWIIFDLKPQMNFFSSIFHKIIYHLCINLNFVGIYVATQSIRRQTTDWITYVRFWAFAGIFLFNRHIQNIFLAHKSFQPVTTARFPPEDKATGECRQTFTSIQSRNCRCVTAQVHFLIRLRGLEVNWRIYNNFNNTLF
jgi:hypothetical protein